MIDARDVAAITDAMAQSLAASAALTSGTTTASRGVVTLDRVENRTEHLMPPTERWAIMARFRALLTASALGEKVTFVLPHNEWRDLEPAQARAAARLKPTHALRATFWSDTRSSPTHRTDAYLCTFRLSDLNSGAILWEDAFELERAITRNTLD